MVRRNCISIDEERMLRYVVDCFVATGEPVSSRMLKLRCRLKESTAHIRSVLHRLEDLGFLFKPHVSAGRIPSDRGYRLYVDQMGTVNALSRPLAQRIQRRIGQDWRDVRDVMAITSQLLGEITSYMGLSMGIRHSRSIVERLEIARLQPRGGLVVLTLFPQAVRKVYVEFSNEYPPAIVDRAVQLINERVAGHPLEKIPERLEAFLRETAGMEREIAGAVSKEAEYLFDWPYDLRYYYGGADRQIDMQELGDPRILQNLVRLMGERSIMLNALKSRFAEDVSITIGKENRIRELEPFAIVTRRFQAAECDGLLGVLGPTRMTYGLVLALLDRTAEELQRIHIGDDPSKQRGGDSVGT